MAHLSTQCGPHGFHNCWYPFIAGWCTSWKITTIKRMRTGGAPIHYFRKPSCTYIYTYVWRFPKIRVLPNHPFIDGCSMIFHYKPYISGYRHVWKTPYIYYYTLISCDVNSLSQLKLGHQPPTYMNMNIYYPHTIHKYIL